MGTAGKPPGCGRMATRPGGPGGFPPVEIRCTIETESGPKPDEAVRLSRQTDRHLKILVVSITDQDVLYRPFDLLEHNNQQSD